MTFLLYLIERPVLAFFLPSEGRQEILNCLPPIWNLRAVSLIPLFYYRLSCSSAPSPVALSVLSFSAFGPGLFFLSLNLLFFRKVGSFVGLLFWLFELLGDVYFSWWCVQPMLPYGAGISLYAFI